MRVHTFLIFLLLLLSARIASAQPDQPLAAVHDDALALPAPATKPRLLLFTGTWDPVSAELADKTLADRRLKSWLEQNAATSGHDVLASTDLTRIHHIRVVPTLVLLGPDSTELDRWTGPQKSSALLRDLKDALAGKTSLAKARGKLKTHEDKDRLEFAETLVASGRYAAALEELIFINDRLDQPREERGKTSFFGPYRSEILRATGRLGKLYPSAADSLRPRRSRYAATALAQPNRDWYEATLVETIDKSLAEPDATLAFFQQLPPTSKARDRLKFDVFEILLKRQAYREAATILTAAEIIERRGKHIEPPKIAAVVIRTMAPLHAGQMLKHLRHYFLKEWSAYVEAYAAHEDPESVRILAQFILEHDKDAVAPAYITAAVNRALGLRADAFLRSLETPSLPAPAPAVVALPTDTPEPPPLPENNDPDLVELSPFLVSEKARGTLPFAGKWRRTTFGHRLKTPITVFGVAPQISTATIQPGDRVLAIDGRAATTFTQEDLTRLWSEGDAGETVTLIVQGKDLDDALYREITVKRIAPPKRPAK
jgi:hypothetical protein